MSLLAGLPLTPALANQPSFMKAMSAVDQLARGETPITSKETEEFWAKLGANSPAAKTSTAQEIRDSIYLVYLYNAEKHLCAATAWMIRSVPRCEGPDRILKQIKAFQRRAGVKSSAIESDHVVFRQYLEAAAARRNLVVNGRTIEITEQSIAQAKRSADQVLERIDLVLGPALPEAQTLAKTSSDRADKPNVAKLGK